MRRKGRIALIILAALALVTASSFAEMITIGKTDCLLQPAAEEDAMKKYVLFPGAGDYFHVFQNCGELTAGDGDLLIPQGSSEYTLCSTASDEVIREIWPTLRLWAEEGYEIILIGYSAGGYPATDLAVKLAGEGHTGRLYLLDGIYGAYRGIYYNEAYYRDHLTAWDVKIWASGDRYVRISERTRKVGSGLAEDENVEYRQYALSHDAMKTLYDVILNGAEGPEPVNPEDGDKGK